jgi:hypothetical protein
LPTPPTNDSMLHVEASAEVNASATSIYRLIADYRTGHSRIISPKYFRNLTVDAGGYGDGTLIRSYLRRAFTEEMTLIRAETAKEKAKRGGAVSAAS